MAFAVLDRVFDSHRFRVLLGAIAFSCVGFPSFSLSFTLPIWQFCVPIHCAFAALSACVRLGELLSCVLPLRDALSVERQMALREGIRTGALRCVPVFVFSVALHYVVW